MDDVIQEVVPCMQRVDKQMTSLTEVKVTMEGNAAKVKREVNEFMDLYVDAIQKQRDVLMAQVTAHVDKGDRMLNVTRLHLLHMRGEVERTCQFVSDLVTGGASDREILAMKGLITDRLKDLKVMETRLPPGLGADLRFNPSDKGDVINNFQMFGRVIVAKQPCPSKSFFSVEGLNNATMFYPCVSSVAICDNEGVKVQTGRDVTVKAWAISQENSGRQIPVYPSSPKDGERSLTFTPMDKGYHFLHVTVLGCAIRNSPYKFFVKRRGRRHLGVFYCCGHCHGEGRGQPTGSCGCGSIGRAAGQPGCYHGNDDHPGCLHWSCCGQTSKRSQCTQGQGQVQGHGTLRPVVRQVTL